MVASFSGAPEHPSWYLNLSDRDANPEVKIRVQQGRLLGRRAGARRRRLRRDLGRASPSTARGTTTTRAGPIGRSRSCVSSSSVPPERERTAATVDVSGIIFASVDCDADAVEDWNRWYDLEHLPPNIALPGIMSGKRYVAPPELHEVRAPADRLEGFADGRGVHVTVYTLNGTPAQVLADMTSTRDVLEDAGRMFAPEKKIVRAGDAMTLSWGVGDPALNADPIDLPHMQHTRHPRGDAARW